MHYLPESLTVRCSVHSRKRVCVCVFVICENNVYTAVHRCVRSQWKLSGFRSGTLPGSTGFGKSRVLSLGPGLDSELLSVLGTCINMTGFLWAWVLEFEIRSHCFLSTLLDHLFIKYLLLNILKNFSDLLIPRF